MNKNSSHFVKLPNGLYINVNKLIYFGGAAVGNGYLVRFFLESNRDCAVEFKTENDFLEWKCLNF